MYFEFPYSALRHQPLAATWVPTLDVCECSTEIVISVEIPGVESDDIHLSWKDGILSISGTKRKQPPQDAGVHYLCVECTYGNFRRDIAINADVDFGLAKGELSNGLLRIRLPKTKRVPKEVVIPIQES